MLKDYVLLINKPAFLTSHDCLAILKKKLKVDKIGHTGTLDPMATGLMIVLVNEATKLSNFILSFDKTYLAIMQLFVKTDSGDITGNVIAEKPYFKIDNETLERVFNIFNGATYDQLVPIYSAVKKDGKKLYQYARKNQTVTLPTRQVTIKSLKLLKYSDNIIEFEVTCSKGTYIRSLVDDMARNLKTIATLTSLKRTHQDIFDINNALLLDDVNQNSIVDKVLSIPEALAPFMKTITIDNGNLIADIANGKPVILENVENADLILLVDQFNNPLAIYYHKKDNIYHNKRGFNFNENYKSQ